MKLPAGDVEIDASPTTRDGLKTQLLQLGRRSFNGYVSWLARGHDGLEEGVVLYQEGKIVAASYEHLKYGTVIDGEKALEPMANVAAGEGLVYSVVGLTLPKINLVLAFNEAAKLPKPIDPKNVADLFPKEYDNSIVLGIVHGLSQREQDRIKILAKYGLVGLRVDEI